MKFPGRTYDWMRENNQAAAAGRKPVLERPLTHIQRRLVSDDMAPTGEMANIICEHCADLDARVDDAIELINSELVDIKQHLQTLAIQQTIVADTNKDLVATVARLLDIEQAREQRERRAASNGIARAHLELLEDDAREEEMERLREAQRRGLRRKGHNAPSPVSAEPVV